MFAVLANSFSMSVSCCLFFSFCEDPVIDATTHPAKHAICHHLLGPVGTATDFPIYRQVHY
jgi:hypothetical protein